MGHPWTLKLIDVEMGLERSVVLDQLELIRLRNVSPAFRGELHVLESGPHQLHLVWKHPEATATLQADLQTHRFTVSQHNGEDEDILMSF